MGQLVNNTDSEHGMVKRANGKNEYAFKRFLLSW